MCFAASAPVALFRYDASKRMESLEDSWVSRANALQRKGRAGRVASGVCFHLFTSHCFQHQLADQQLPEIQRVPLEQLCLRYIHRFCSVCHNYTEKKTPNLIKSTFFFFWLLPTASRFWTCSPSKRWSPSSVASSSRRPWAVWTRPSAACRTWAP